MLTLWLNKSLCYCWFNILIFTFFKKKKFCLLKILLYHCKTFLCCHWIHIKKQKIWTFLEIIFHVSFFVWNGFVSIRIPFSYTKHDMDKMCKECYKIERNDKKLSKKVTEKFFVPLFFKKNLYVFVPGWFKFNFPTEK